MAAVVFTHFAASGAALVLRYQSRPFIRRVRSCCNCIYGCCTCRCLRRQSPSAEPMVMARSERGGDGLPILKWYWFHLFAQVGFMVREAQVVTQRDGWCWEVISAHIATWLTILVVTSEVWHFSKVRQSSEKQKVAIDGLLDMLLLPVNIGFFCVLCVRALTLQPDGHMAAMVPFVIESPEIYEALALWSVLELFVKVVRAETEASSGGNENAKHAFESFQTISLQGVQAWVFIQSAAVIFKLALEGFVAVHLPTVCYAITQTCKSCKDWFEDNVETALTAVNFLLCSFAIMFVFYFEAGYKDHLHKIGPMWKFLGVKGIVSVTYFQWVVISSLAAPLAWDKTRVYLLHCLLYAFWMPVLALVHKFLAYPYSSPWKRDQRPTLHPWLTAWLGTLRSTGKDGPRAGGAARAGDAVEDGSVGANTPSGDDDPSEPEPGPEQMVDAENGPEQTERGHTDLSSLALSPHHQLFYFVYGCLCCYASVEAILWLVPAIDNNIGDAAYHFTCNSQGDLTHHLQAQHGLHFVELNDTVTKWSMPGVAGTWLPLCASTPVACELGHHPAPTQGRPTVSCSANGTYSYQGSCQAISCGKPDPPPHAIARSDDWVAHNWTLGVVINYDCEKPGYRGWIKAECKIDKEWKWTGQCEEVACGPPPSDVPNARLVLHPKWKNETIRTGTAVRYQCDKDYHGTPVAMCGDDGMYVTTGRCKRECAPPPNLPHASPDVFLENSGWMEGMIATYTCNPTYVGVLSATCNSTGKYTVSGFCGADPASETKALRSQVQMLQGAFGLENFIILGAVGVWMWNVRCYMGARGPREVGSSPSPMHRNSEVMLTNRYDA